MSHQADDEPQHEEHSATDWYVSEWKGVPPLLRTLVYRLLEAEIANIGLDLAKSEAESFLTGKVAAAGMRQMLTDMAGQASAEQMAKMEKGFQTQEQMMLALSASTAETARVKRVAHAAALSTLRRLAQD